jgi:hypothetical protein
VKETSKGKKEKDRTEKIDGERMGINGSTENGEKEKENKIKQITLR